VAAFDIYQVKYKMGSSFSSCSATKDTLQNIASKGEDVAVHITEHKGAVLETMQAFRIPEKGIIAVSTGFAVIEGVEAIKGTPIEHS